MESRKQNAFRIARTVLAAIIGIALFTVLLTELQLDVAMRRQRSNTRAKLQIAVQRMEESMQDAEADWEIYDDFITAKVNTVAWILENAEGAQDKLAEIAERWGLCVVYVTDENGRIEYGYGGGDAEDLQSAGVGRLLAYARGEEERPYVTENDICYYLSRRTNGGYVVGGRESSAIIAAQEERYTPAYSLRDIGIGMSGYVAAIRTSDHTIAYAKDESLIGRSISEMKMSPVPTTGTSGRTNVNGEAYYFETLKKKMGGEDYLLIGMVPTVEITNASRPVIRSAVGILCLTSLMMIIYMILRCRDIKTGKVRSNRYFRLFRHTLLDLSEGAILKNFAVISLVILITGTAYTICLTSIARQMKISDSKLNDVDEIMLRDDARTQTLRNYYDREYGHCAENIAWTLSFAPELINDDALAQLRERAQIREIDVYDQRGRMQATTTVYKDFEISDNKSDQSYPFREVLKGYKDILVQEAMPNETTGEVMQYIGVKRLDAKGMIQIAVNPVMLTDRLYSTNYAHLLQNLVVENGGCMIAVDMETGTFAAHPDEKMIGRPVIEYGMTDSALKDDYIGRQMINDTYSLVMTRMHEGTLVCIAVPMIRICASILPVSAMVGIAGLLILLIMVLSAIMVSEKTVLPVTGTNDKKAARVFEISTQGGTTMRTTAAAARWDSSGIRFRELDAAGKLGRVIFAVMEMMGLALLVLTISGSMRGSELITFILSKRWEHTISTFSVTYVLISIVQILTISAVSRKVILSISCMISTQAETIGRLLNSFIKYIAVIGSIFYGLQFFGVDSTAMLAGAGILTLIVGLGAQSLVADILAGLFIVFEGEFRVGDIVTVDDWRGSVEEIGIRTTKIKSPGQDIKILRNSSISGVINQTRQYSYASVDVGIEYEESLERVEAILSREMPHIREHLPSIVDGPFYKGVVALGDSSVVLRVVAMCGENDRIQLQRDMNREIKLIFDRNDVGIPFPQIVINQAAQHADATPGEKRDAAIFVNKQKEHFGHAVSKDGK